MIAETKFQSLLLVGRVLRDKGLGTQGPGVGRPGCGSYLQFPGWQGAPPQGSSTSQSLFASGLEFRVEDLDLSSLSFNFWTLGSH